MACEVFVKRRLEEIEEKLLTYKDPVERMYVWFRFIKDFTQEAHTLFDSQYEEFVKLCEQYSLTPDPTARKDLKRQIRSCVKEINTINMLLKRVPRIQTRLERSILKD